MQEKGTKCAGFMVGGIGAVLVVEDGSVFQAEAPKRKAVNSGWRRIPWWPDLNRLLFEDWKQKSFLQMGVRIGKRIAFSEELANRAGSSAFR